MAMVRMTLMDCLQMTLIDFYLQRRKGVVVVVVEAVDVDHCIHPTFAEIAAVAVVQTQMKMMRIVVVVMVDLPVEYVVVTQAGRVVSMVAV